jgi:hypothetical protein
MSSVRPPAGHPPTTTRPAAPGRWRSWTDRVRGSAVQAVAPKRLLPQGQPTYVASWIYVFGVATIASLIVTISSGVILSLKGPAWWHYTGIGHFFNAMHLWAVELFFFFMVIHMWGKYWMAAWRGGRGRVWATGATSFLVGVPAALTGYLSQQNFDAQWISTQAMDGINSIGAGAFFNVTDFGQMYSYHVLILPSAVALLVIWHILLVRRHGLVPPLDLQPRRRTVEANRGPAGGTREPQGSEREGVSS